MKLTFRSAIEDDLVTLVLLLADDPLGAGREDTSEPLNASYRSAFAAIVSDPNNELIVVEHDGVLVGTLQLTFLPGLSRCVRIK